MEHKITLITYLNNHLLKEILVESSLFEFFFFVNKSITVLLKLSIELIESFLHIKADVKFILSSGIEFFNSLISSQWTIIIIVIIRFISVWSPGKINRSFYRDNYLSPSSMANSCVLLTLPVSFFT